MIKFPLYVTLDTNIFDSNKLDFSKDSTLSLLINYVETGKIKIVLSNIVVKEVEKHIVRAMQYGILKIKHISIWKREQILRNI